MILKISATSKDPATLAAAARTEMDSLRTGGRTSLAGGTTSRGPIAIEVGVLDYGPYRKHVKVDEQEIVIRKGVFVTDISAADHRRVVCRQ